MKTPSFTGNFFFCRGSIGLELSIFWMFKFSKNFFLFILKAAILLILNFLHTRKKILYKIDISSPINQLLFVMYGILYYPIERHIQLEVSTL
jgi:hypothetical protein